MVPQQRVDEFIGGPWVNKASGQPGIDQGTKAYLGARRQAFDALMIKTYPCAWGNNKLAIQVQSVCFLLKCSFKSSLLVPLPKQIMLPLRPVIWR